MSKNQGRQVFCFVLKLLTFYILKVFMGPKLPTQVLDTDTVRSIDSYLPMLILMAMLSHRYRCMALMSLKIFYF